MKKNYSLDYTLQLDTERLDYVNNIINNTEIELTDHDLELMVTYIMSGINPDTGTRNSELDENRRYQETYKRACERVLPLDSITETEIATSTTDLKRPTYKRQRTAISRTADADIPGMRSLWDSIDTMAHTLAVNTGEVPAEPGDTIITTPYNVYKLKHWLIDLRRHQYYLKDSYKPAIHFLNVTPPSSQTVNFTADSAYYISKEEFEKRLADPIYKCSPAYDPDPSHYEWSADGTTVRWIVRHQTFDWENPKHIRALMDYYSDIYMQDYDKLDSYGRTLIVDFDFYAEKAKFSPLREYIILRKIDKAPYGEICAELHAKYGVNYSESYLCSILANEIPNAIARSAYIHRLRVTTPPDHYRICTACGNAYPLDPIFFGPGRHASDPYAKRCRACSRKHKGDEPQYDTRKKDPTMRPLQARDEYGEFSANEKSVLSKSKELALHVMSGTTNSSR